MIREKSYINITIFWIFSIKFLSVFFEKLLDEMNLNTEEQQVLLGVIYGMKSYG